MPTVVRLEISRQSQISWNGTLVADRAALESLLQAAAQLTQQPENPCPRRPQDPLRHRSSGADQCPAPGLAKVGVVGLEAYARKPYCRAVRTLVGMACGWLVRKGLISRPHGAWRA